MNGANRTDSPPGRDHLLLTVLGTNPRPACYGLGDRQAEAKLAPIALLDLLPEADRPRRVLAICTPEAKDQTWPLLEQELTERSHVDFVEVSSGDAQEDVDAFLTAVTKAIPENVELTVDVTHGFRHFSFLTYVAVLYLAALRGVRVRGAYYGLLRPNEVSPFLDLRPLLQLPRWIHALEVLGETGSFSPLANALKDEPANQTAQIASGLTKLSESFLSGLPLELGRHANLFCKQSLSPLTRLLAGHHRLPLAANLKKQLKETLANFALDDSVSGDGWKGQVHLSEAELQRQAGIIDALLEYGNVATALGLMNEWTVSWVVLRCYPADDWLNYGEVRRKAAGLLGAIEGVRREPDLSNRLSPEQRALGKFWKDLSDLRNAYHYHGMRPQVLVGDGQATAQLKEVEKYWKETLRSCPSFDLLLGQSPGSRVLVSPVGMQPGVLFSALHACREQGGDVNTCVVICSRETQDLIAEASRRADFTGTVEPLVLDDPYGGLAELDGLVKEARRWFIGSDRVFVNVTGGTTLIGLAAEKLADAARKLACPVRRFGLIDRRPPKQQDEEPYQVSEVFWLDAQEDGHANHH